LHREAIECFETAIKIKNDDPSAYLNKAISIAEVGYNKEAIKLVDSALELDANFTHAFYNK